ncbi:MAG: hypothetical protein OEY39_07585 [Candidatus Bathyarchaeota archaeon]|nr:hypothetical protein [Candidatus Bathyarchaeota archaeon]
MAKMKKFESPVEMKSAPNTVEHFSSNFVKRAKIKPSTLPPKKNTRISEPAIGGIYSYHEGGGGAMTV